jgi:hypothetical protein
MAGLCESLWFKINMSNYKFKKMKKLLLQTLLLIFALIASGCASSYKAINPPRLNYSAHDLQVGISLSYKYDVLREKGNKKFSRKEDNKRIKLIAVRITNHTDSVVNVARDLVFYSGNEQIFPMEPMAIKNTLRQIVPAYLPYLLLSFLNLHVYDEKSVKTYRIGLLLGPGLTIGNMAVAGSANNQMLTELMEYNIIDKDIPAGRTIYGLIGIRDAGYDPITVKLRK